MESKDKYNPQLFRFDPQAAYEWQVFPRVTVATITWNRLEHTRKLVDSLLRYTHMPFRLLVVDNASDDGTQEYLASLADVVPDLEVIANGQNRGKSRALLQIRDRLDAGLLVYFDNDVEILSNYWLLHVQKAYFALHRNLGRTDFALGVRLLNCEEYGFMSSHEHVVLPAPGCGVRSSFAAGSKDDADLSVRDRELVCIGWTDFLIGPVHVWPVEQFRQVRFEDVYPNYIGGVDNFLTAESLRLGMRCGFIKNGPVARHNDWPYTEEKMQLYDRLRRERAVTDGAYVGWKLRDAWARLLRRAGRGGG